MENWEDIIEEEVKKMMDNIQERGVSPDILNVSVHILVPGKNRKEEDFLEVENIDDILKTIQNRKISKNKKCSCCGKVSNTVKMNEAGEYVCQECNKKLDIYRDKISKIVDAYEKDESITLLVKDLAQSIIKNKKEEEFEDETDEVLKDFVENEILTYAMFEDKEDIVNFLDDVITYIETHEIEM